ncbi:hypothetical protein [Caballeronia sp. BCC1704]|uniref:hypothetical protein n=1 Tax=Caballeronia sp. BCC1704 TaxID=2676300 RepID=UPI00158EE09D|nr:hypothetical protein [Caballeronia sp. BCC1704]
MIGFKRLHLWLTSELSHLAPDVVAPLQWAAQEWAAQLTGSEDPYAEPDPYLLIGDATMALIDELSAKHTDYRAAMAVAKTAMDRFYAATPAAEERARAEWSKAGHALASAEAKASEAHTALRVRFGEAQRADSMQWAAASEAHKLAQATGVANALPLRAAADRPSRRL